MKDSELRALQRSANQGDEEAKHASIRHQARTREPKRLVFSFASGISTRTKERFHKHIRKECRPHNCRFCRRERQGLVK